MTQGVLCSLRPFVVTIDVSVELPLVSMEVTLCFGPFNSLSAAEAWAGEVERLHKVIEKKDDDFFGEVFDVTRMPTDVWLRSLVHGVDIIQTDQGARKPGALIPVHTPAVDARDMHIYALKAFDEAISHALLCVAQDEEE